MPGSPRKNLDWQEDVKAKEDLDKLMRVKHGEAKHGGDRKSKDFQVTESVTRFTKIKSDLENVSETIIQEDIQLAEALKKLRKT